MKAIAIIWNSMREHFNEALDDISNDAKIFDALKINFSDEFNSFISNIYPYEGDERWKLEYKTNILNRNDQNLEICILFLDVPDSTLKYVERKKQYIYENVEALKQKIRGKYKNIIDFYSYDNVFHMTDNEMEFNKTVLVVKKFLLSLLLKNRGFICLDDFFIDEKKFIDHNEEHGKRDKFWFANEEFMFKNAKDNTFEIYSELFPDEICRILGIEVANYFPSTYNSHEGLITVNFLSSHEILITANELISSFLKHSYNCNNIPIELICKYNNLEDLPKIIENYCINNGLVFTCNIKEELSKIYAFDTILMQTDRTPNNIGIIINNKTKTAKMSPLYDNSNIMGMNKDKNVISNYSLYELYELPTMLNLSREDDFFSNKLLNLETINDEDLILKLNEYIEVLNSISLEEIFDDVCVKYGIDLPSEFKNFMRENFVIHLQNIELSLKDSGKSLNKTKSLI